MQDARCKDATVVTRSCSHRGPTLRASTLAARRLRARLSQTCQQMPFVNAADESRGPNRFDLTQTAQTVSGPALARTAQKPRYPAPHGIPPQCCRQVSTPALLPAGACLAAHCGMHAHAVQTRLIGLSVRCSRPSLGQARSSRSICSSSAKRSASRAHANAMRNSSALDSLT